MNPVQTVLFPSVSYIRAAITKAGQRQDTLLPIVIDCVHMTQVVWWSGGLVVYVVWWSGGLVVWWSVFL